MDIGLKRAIIANSIEQESGRLDDGQLQHVWKQQDIRVILRRTGKSQLLRVRIPHDAANRAWLQDGRRISPAWMSRKRYGEIPKAWFNDFVERALKTFGKVYVIQPFREHEKCSPACLNAVA